MSEGWWTSLSLAVPPRSVVQSLDDHLISDPQLIRRWFSEALLIWARWGLVAVLLVLAILFPANAQWLVLAVAILVSIGNVISAWLLHRGLRIRSLSSLSALATVLEWGAALGVSIAFRRELDSVSPYVLLLFLFPVSYRYGLRGLLSGLVAIGAMVTIWFGAHLLLFDFFTADSMRSLTIEWVVFLILAALFMAALIQADNRRLEWEHIRLQTFRRERAGLSNREWEVLLLVAESSLTYEDIGYLLNISPETVKTHVRRIGNKLSASGREQVVEKARSQNLLPVEDSIVD